MNDEYQRLPLQNSPWPTVVYLEQSLPEFRGNPLIEALPPILSAMEAYERLCLTPIYNDEERKLSPELRYTALFRLQQFFQPVMQHLELERKFSSLIRSGSLSRNPLDPAFVQQVTGNVVPGVRSSASSLTFMGFSGIGKTTAIERVLSLYPQSILHTHPVNLFQIVWLKLNCPHESVRWSILWDALQGDIASER
ncbi:P-loop NTPase family protein [Paenibacillus tyrfis]|uniref:hypothetical protein n=1 Tax=Paenibacillus tyrfis TaxID=1501230 RepID=UPI0026A87628